MAIGFNALTALGISILLARMLGPSDLGIYRLTRTLTYLISVLIGLGMPSAVIKFVAEQETDHLARQKILTATIVMSSIIGFLMAAVFFSVSPMLAVFFGNHELVIFFQLTSPLLLLFSLNTTMQSYLVGLHRMRAFSFSIILENVMLVIFTIVFVLNGQGALGAIEALIIGAFMNSLYLIKSTNLRQQLVFKDIKKKSRQILTFGLNILASTVVNQVNYRADVLALGYFLKEKEVGFYSVGITLGSFFLLLPSAIQKVTYPATSKYWGNDLHETLHELLDRTTRYTMLALLIVAFPFLLFSREIIITLYGNEFLPSLFVLQILILGMIIDGGLGQCIGGTLSGMGRPDLSAKISTVVAILNFLFLITFIPMLGIVGAALATALGYMIRGFLTYYFSFSKTHTPIALTWLAKVFGITGMFYVLSFFMLDIFPSFLNIHLRLGFILLLWIAAWFIFLSREDRTFLLTLARHQVKVVASLVMRREGK